MRPIDADKIVAYLHKQLEFAKLNNDRCLNVAFKHAILKLDNAPTIDAVPVIRCKDCKNSQPLYDPDMVWCNWWKEEVYNKGFCHMGFGGGGVEIG